MPKSLYERLGGTEGIHKIASDALNNHLVNPRVMPRFVHLDNLKAARKDAANFFISATGGPNVYEGKNIRETHQGMNIDEAEFMAVIDDILDSLTGNRIAQREQEEVLFALYSMRREIIHVQPLLDMISADARMVATIPATPEQVTRRIMTLLKRGNRRQGQV